MEKFKNGVAYTGYFLRALCDIPGDIVVFIKGFFKGYKHSAETVIGGVNITNIHSAIFFLLFSCVRMGIKVGREDLITHKKALAMVRARCAWVQATGSFIDRQIIGEWNEQI